MKKKSTPKSKIISTKNRRLKTPQYQSFRMSKRLKTTQPKLPASKELARDALVNLRSNRRVFLGMTFIYGLLMLVFVRGLAGSLNVTSTKETIAETLGTSVTGIQTNLDTFATLISRGNSEIASLYQTIIVLICSLAFIWTLRQTTSKGTKQLRVTDGFYKGMYPLVPVLLVLMVIALQLIPLSIAGTLYASTIVGGVAITLAEQVAWLLIIFLLALLSLYMLSSSIFALYIATLPDMTPMNALRSARKLVLHRRLIIARKILWLGAVLLALLFALILPLVIFVPAVAEFAYFIYTISLLPLTHSYMYNLYRSLL